MEFDYEGRFKLLEYMTHRNTRELLNCLTSRDPKIYNKRKLKRIKIDGDSDSGITLIEYEIGAHDIACISEQFENDSYQNEETPWINPKADPETDCEWTCDPADGTKRLQEWEMPDSGKYEPVSSPAYLLACIRRRSGNTEDNPFAFGAGYPLCGEIYTGCIDKGIFLNGKPYRTPENRSELVILLNDGTPENAASIAQHTGRPWHGYDAGSTCFLLLKRLVGGLYLHCHTKNAEEIPCIVAAAKLMGARVTDRFGAEYRFYRQTPDPTDRIVISFPHLDHDALCNKIIKLK